MIHDVVKYYGANKDFDQVIPLMSNLLIAAVSHSHKSAYAVTEACHLLLTDDKTDLNALVRLRNICIELDLATKIASKGDFAHLAAATRLAKLL